MSLVAGRGLLSTQPAGWFTPPLAEGTVYIEPHPRRIQAFRGGAAQLDTEHALMVHRAGHPLSYAFPSDQVGNLPNEPVVEAPGYVSVPWDAVDEWFEEGRKLVHYPPNPYHRVDCRPTRRGLRVTAGDAVLVDTDDTVIVFETALEPRLYVGTHPGPHRSPAAQPDHVVLQLQGHGHLLVSRRRGHRHRRCGVELPRHTTGVPAHPGFPQLRRHTHGRAGRTPPSGTTATCGCEL